MSCLYCGKNPGLSFFKRKDFCSPEHEALWQEQEASLVNRLIQATVPEAPAVPLSALIHPPPAPEPVVKDVKAKEKPPEPVAVRSDSEPDAKSTSASAAPPVCGFRPWQSSPRDMRRPLAFTAAAEAQPSWTRGLIRESADGITLDKRISARRLGQGNQFTAIPAPPANASVGKSEESTESNRTNRKLSYAALLPESRERRLPSVTLPADIAEPSTPIPADFERQTNRSSSGTPRLAIPRRPTERKFATGNYPLEEQAGLSPTGPSKSHAPRAKDARQVLGSMPAPRVRPALPNAAFASSMLGKYVSMVRRGARSAWRTGRIDLATEMREVSRRLKYARAVRFPIEAIESLKMLGGSLVPETANPRALKKQVLPLCRLERKRFVPVSTTFSMCPGEASTAGAAHGKPSDSSAVVKTPVAVLLSEPSRNHFLAAPGRLTPLHTEAFTSDRKTPVRPEGRFFAQRPIAMERRPSDHEFASPKYFQTGDIARLETILYGGIFTSDTKQFPSRLPGTESAPHPLSFSAPRRESSGEFVVAQYAGPVEQIRPASFPVFHARLSLILGSGPTGQQPLSVPRRIGSRDFAATQYVEPLVAALSAEPERALTTLGVETAASAQRTVAMQGRVALPPLAVALHENLAPSELTETVRHDLVEAHLAQPAPLLSRRAASRALVGAGYPIAVEIGMARMPRAKTYASHTSTPSQAREPLLVRARKTPFNAAFETLDVSLDAPRLLPRAEGVGFSTNAPPRMAARAGARFPQHGQLAPICPYSGELFSPKVYIQDRVLPSPDRLALKGHRLLQLPECRRAGSAAFIAIPTVLTVPIGASDRPDAKTKRPFADLLVRKFRYKTFHLEARTLRLAPVSITVPEIAPCIFNGTGIEEQALATPVNPAGAMFRQSSLNIPRRAVERKLRADIDPAQITFAPAVRSRAQARRRLGSSLPPVEIIGRVRQAPVEVAFLSLSAEPNAPVIERRIEGSWRSRNTEPVVPSRIAPRILSFGAPIRISHDTIENPIPQPATVDQACTIPSSLGPSLDPPSFERRHAKLESAPVASFWRDPSPLQPARADSNQSDLLLKQRSFLSPSMFRLLAASRLPSGAAQTIWTGASKSPVAKITKESTLAPRDPARSLLDAIRSGKRPKSFGPRTFVPWGRPASTPIPIPRLVELEANGRTLPRLSLRARLQVSETARASSDASFVIASKGAPGTQQVSAWEPFRLNAPFAPWQALVFQQTGPGEPFATASDASAAHASLEKSKATEEQKLAKVSAPVLSSSQPDGGPTCELTWSTWKVSRGY